MRHANRSLKNLCAGTGVQLICIRPTSQSQTKTKRVPRNPVFHNCSCKAPPTHALFAEHFYSHILCSSNTKLQLIPRQLSCRENPHGGMSSEQTLDLCILTHLYTFLFILKNMLVYIQLGYFYQRFLSDHPRDGNIGP